MKKIDEAIGAIEKVKQRDAKKNQQTVKKLFLSSIIVESHGQGEDGWEVAKYFLSDDLVYNSENKKQLSRARREAAANKKKREASKQKLKKKRSSGMFLSSQKKIRDLQRTTPRIQLHQ